MFILILLHIFIQNICKFIIEFVTSTCRSHRFNDKFKKKIDNKYTYRKMTPSEMIINQNSLLIVHPLNKKTRDYQLNDRTIRS